MSEQRTRGRGGRRPFAGPIGDEQAPARRGPLGSPAVPVIGGEGLLGPEVARVASDAVLDRLEPARKRFEGLSPRSRAALLIGAGGLVTTVMWALAIAAPAVFAALPPRVRGLWIVPLVVGPAVLAYGGMMLLVPPTEPPPADDRFGGVLAEARAQLLWKMRLGAVALGLVHWMLFNAAR